jgi:DNA-binding response OmpR family regulator
MLQDQSLLLVENSERDADMLKILLESEGFSVDTVSTGWAALEKLKLRKYASVILDFGLPDMKGDELADKIKIEAPWMRIILLTGFRSVIDSVKLNKFDYVLEKPVDPKRILKALGHVINIAPE